MERLGGFIERIGLAMAGKKNPWGGGPKGNDEGGEGGEASSGEGDGEKPRGPRNPWLPGGGGADERGRRSASIEDIFRSRGPEGPRRGRGGGTGGPRFTLPRRPDGRSWLPAILGGIALLWVGLTSVHVVGAREQGLVAWLGSKYSRTLNPGLNFTAPWPIQSVDIENVSEIRRLEIPDNSSQKLILTGDQNLVDVSYLVRWSIKDLQLFRYRLAKPEETVQEAAESAMRQSVAEQDLDSVVSGAGRAQIELGVHQRMQAILDGYRSGVAVQGVEVVKTDPPESVIEAFRQVSAAEQQAQRSINEARRYSQQVLAQAQGEAAAFDEIYEQYRLAPEVTRRRLYYETMETILSKTDMTIIEADGVTPYLPLPELRRRAQQSSTEGQ
ncbi:MAG TPA: protease modulator HflK [Sphingomonadaceae bacterium]|nr:protease modulator HflK [Sphingomonadaceae bacterium]